MNSTIIITPNKMVPHLMEHFEALIWLCKATSEDSKRPTISKTIMVKDGICYATDGHRLHVYRQCTDSLPNDVILADGRYLIAHAGSKQLIFSVRDDNSDFPDVWKILSYRPSNGIPPFVSISERTDYSRFLYHVYRHTALFDESMLRDAYRPGRIEFERTGRDPLSGLVFGDEDQFALVMPLKES